MAKTSYFTAEGKVSPEVLTKFRCSRLVKHLETRTKADLKPVYADKNAWVEGNDAIPGKCFIKAPTIRLCRYTEREASEPGVVDADMALLDKLLAAARKTKD